MRHAIVRIVHGMHQTSVMIETESRLYRDYEPSQDKLNGIAKLVHNPNFEMRIRYEESLPIITYVTKGINPDEFITPID